MRERPKPPLRASERRDPEVPVDLLPLRTARELMHETRETLIGRLIEDLDLDDLPPTSLRLEGCVLRRVNFSGSILPGLSLTDVRLEDCNLCNVEARRLAIVRAALVGCRLTGLQAIEAHCEHLLVEDCEARYIQLRFGEFRAFELSKCNLQEADFNSSDLRGARFASCNLQEAEMLDVKLDGADIRGSNVEQVRAKPEDLRGVTVDPAQALVLAGILGLKVR